MREVAIVRPMRTAVGRFGGSLKDIPAADLGATVARAILAKTGLAPDRVDDVILGQGYPSGEEPAVGRIVALKAGLPIETPFRSQQGARERRRPSDRCRELAGYSHRRRNRDRAEAILDASVD